MSNAASSEHRLLARERDESNRAEASSPLPPDHPLDHPDNRIQLLENRVAFLEAEQKRFTNALIQLLENRVAFVEAEQKRFTNALISAGAFLFKNPASKMMLAAFPKEMQNKLKEFFDGTQTGQ
jgi:hypothetical protein